jgi:hypothetical protein
MCYFFEKTVENKRSVGSNAIKNPEIIEILKYLTFYNV